MKHIAIVTTCMASGGAERVISQLLKYWSSKCKCTLILVKQREIFYNIPPTVNLIEIGQQNSNRVIDKLKSYAKIRDNINNINPDVVLAMPEDIGIYTTLSLIGCRIPIVVSERNDPSVMPNLKITRILRHLAYKFVNGFIFQTKNAMEYFNKNIKKRGIVLYNPLDLERIPDPYSGRRKKNIVSAGRLTQQKNFQLLIDAFSLFYKKYPEYTLTIYGEGELLEHLKEHSKRFDSYQNIIFPGNSKNLLEVIKDAEIFVLSSDYEGVPNVLIEAMATGIPVISTDCKPGGASALITNHKNGILVPTGDIKKLYESMIFLVENQAIANCYAVNALQIKEQMDAEIISQKWMDFLIKNCKN